MGIFAKPVIGEEKHERSTRRLFEQSPERPSRVKLDLADTENIEVIGSHCGLGFNPVVLYAVADRLAQPKEGRKSFDKSGLRSLFYR